MMLKEKYPNVAFGTSGVRALVSDLNQSVIFDYTYAFIKRMEQSGLLLNGQTLALAMDLRPSSSFICNAIKQSVEQLGYEVTFLGEIPTPALALHCFTTKSPGIMVTGSHIPFDRNGMKFYSPIGEILKDDEVAISSTKTLENSDAFIVGDALEANPIAKQAYINRYIDFFGKDILNDINIGVYQHSAVGRDVVTEILSLLGANVVSLGRSDEFIPIDTEAVTQEDATQAKIWCKQYHLDALVSTDGDGDRPMVFDANGEFVRGDILGLLTAKLLKIENLVVPVSCNTAIEKSGDFKQVIRTKIGSPYVIAEMNEIIAHGEKNTSGFEANGGFILGAMINSLAALPTRDAMLPIIAGLVLAIENKTTLALLVESLPQRYTHSDRLKNFPSNKSQEILSLLINSQPEQQAFFKDSPGVANVNTTDGARFTLSNGDVVHLRASGNAPELRCYAESDAIDKAMALCSQSLKDVVKLL
ncbi:MAG: phosphomannomutase [Methylophilus sp.]|jgi:phosphomannomutase